MASITRARVLTTPTLAAQQVLFVAIDERTAEPGDYVHLFHVPALVRKRGKGLSIKKANLLSFVRNMGGYWV